MSSQIESYSIADFLDWHSLNRLRLNPEFQRRDVWSKNEKVFLIDTILRGWSVPKIYFRTTVDSGTKQLLRDVVDGQQRLRAIITFANNELVLNAKAGEHEGKKYKDLDEDDKQNFLQYKISTEQLINIEDIEITKIFARLNQYGVKLNAAELRNAEFDGLLRWAVVEQSSKWSPGFKSKNILTIKQISRMSDDELMAEFFQIHLKGIQGGDAISLRSLYKSYDKKFHDRDDLVEKMDCIINYLFIELEPYLPDAIRTRVNFIMLYAATANAMYGINTSEFDMSGKSYRLPKSSDEMEESIRKIQEIADVISSDDFPSSDWRDFYTASRSAPINAKSRRIRFLPYADVFQFGD
jgi:Protein of unknown function DUF262